MKLIESKGIPTQSETSSQIRQIRQLEAATFHLRRRKDAVQQDLKKPGLVADRVRLHELLQELEQIFRALRGQFFGRSELVSSHVDRCMSQMESQLRAKGVL
jgi:hypothetical protein